MTMTLLQKKQKQQRSALVILFSTAIVVVFFTTTITPSLPWFVVHAFTATNTKKSLATTSSSSSSSSSISSARRRYSKFQGKKLRLKTSTTTVLQFQEQQQQQTSRTGVLVSPTKNSDKNTKNTAGGTKRRQHSTKKQQKNQKNQKNQKKKTKKTKKTKKISKDEIQTRLHRIRSEHQTSTDSYNITELNALLLDSVKVYDASFILDVLHLIQLQQNSTNTNAVVLSHDTYTKCLNYCCFHTVPDATLCTAILDTMTTPTILDYSYGILCMCRTEQYYQHHTNGEQQKTIWYDDALEMAYAVTNTTDAAMQLPTLVYDSILTCLLDHKKWKTSITLLRYMEQQQQSGSAPVLSTYRLVIECCVQANQIEQALLILQSCCQRTKDGSIVLLQRQQQQNTSRVVLRQPTIYPFEIIMTAVSRNQQWSKGLQLLDLLENYRTTAASSTMLKLYNTVLRMLCKARELSTAQQLLRRMQNGAPHPDIISYNTVLAVCANKKYYFNDVMKIFNTITVSPGILPDMYTYTSIIRACAKAGKTERALTVWRVVQDKQLPVDAYIYTAVIEACANGKLWQKAMSYLNEMESNSIQPSDVTYSVVIKAYGNALQWEQALSLLDTMKDKGMKIDLRVYNSAVTALSKAAKKRNKTSSSKEKLSFKVMSLLDEMKANGVEPDGFTFSSAISCYGEDGLWKEALTLIDTMNSGGPRTKPNKIAYTAAISSCGKSGKVTEALKLFDQMRGQGLAIDVITYNALFNALRIGKESDRAYTLWNDMLESLSAETQQRRSAVRRASRSIASPDIITITSVIAAVASNKKAESTARVDAIFSEAVRRRILLHEDTLDSSSEYDLSGFSIPVARAACRFCLKRMKESDCSPTSLTFITGVGVHSKQRCDSNPSMSLRDCVQQTLLDDFSLPSSIPRFAQGTVEVDNKALTLWMREASS